MDMYGKADDGVPTKKPWTEQEVLLLLEVLNDFGCAQLYQYVCDDTMTTHTGSGIAP